jgi:hypothetical protein
MSVIASIDCGYLATVQAMADELWTDPIKNIDLVASAESARAVLANQQVSFAPLQSKTKNYTVSLEWLQVCDLEVESCSDDCSIDGEDASPVCKDYELDCMGELSFKVFDRVYRERTIDGQQSVAYNLEMRKKTLDESIAQAVDAALLLNAGTNVFTGAPGTVAAGVTTLGANAWNDNIWGYLALVARMNKFNSPYGITGYNLYQLIYNRLAEIANADGKGNVAKMGDLKSRMYLDPENVEVIAPAYTFLLHKTALAILNKAWYPVGGANAVQLTADRMAWSESSRNLPGIFYDVFTERGCLSNDYYTAYKVQAHGLIALNPTPCSETNTGILAFACE